MNTILSPFSKKKVIFYDAFLVLIFLIQISNYGIGSTKYQYFFLICVIFIFILSALFYKRIFVGLNNFFDYIPAFLVLIWIYGMVSGLVQGVSLLLVISNFAAMFMYSLYYVFHHFKVSYHDLTKLIFFAAIVNSLYSLHAIFLADFSFGRGLDIVSFRFYYSIGISTLYPLLALYLFSYFSPFTLPRDELISRYRFLFPILVIALFASMSKGFILGFFIIFVCLIYYFLLRFFGLKKIKISQLFFLVISVTSLLLFIYTFFDLLSYNLSSNQVGNLIRNQQGVELLNDLSFFGNGLGSSISNGYSRDILGYGFELSYHNVIHKFGVFAIPIFLIFFVTLIIGLRFIFSKYNFLRIRGVLVIGCMSYLVPAYGNPFLFSPTVVLLHVIAIYIISITYKTFPRNLF